MWTVGEHTTVEFDEAGNKREFTDPALFFGDELVMPFLVGNHRAGVDELKALAAHLNATEFKLPE